MAEVDSLGREVFSVSFKGYAREEVDEAMRNFAAKDRQLRAEVAEARAERDKLKSEIEGLHTIVNAAKASTQKGDAKAVEIRHELERAVKELDRMKAERDSFQALAERLAAEAAGTPQAAVGAYPEGFRQLLDEARALSGEAAKSTAAAKERLDSLVRKLAG